MVGTRLGRAEQGHLVGFGVWGFKSFGTKPKEPGHDHGSHTQGGRACRGSCSPALSALNLGFLQIYIYIYFNLFFLIRGSTKKKKLETKETRETERKMSAPARQSKLAPAPWGEGGCCPCCPDLFSMATGQKGDQVEMQ